MDNKLKVITGQYSNKGIKDINQDFNEIDIPQQPLLTTKGIVATIADGISSSKVSQEASKMSVLTFLKDYFSTSESWSVKKSAFRVIHAMNSWLYSRNVEDKFHLDKDRGYVCTFSALILKSNKAHIFHVGDTRVYLLRDNKLEQLTKDHRVWVSNEKSYLSRALGIDNLLAIDYETVDLKLNDTFLLMSDGVYEFLDEEYLISEINIENKDLNELSKTMVEKSLEKGSDDNLTIQIIKVTNLPQKDSNELQQDIEQKPFAPLLEEKQIFDGFTIIRELSSTSRSHIYLALDEESKIEVIIKIPSVELREDKALLERFMFEEWIANRVNSTHILKSFKMNREKNYLYIVTEYIQGKTLAQWMLDNPNPTLDEVRDILGQIAKGLYAFHRQEMLHQDLRPENILIDKHNTVKIIDFGSTKVEGILELNTYMKDDHILGTALYSAPEYFLGESGTVKSEIYSLGVIAYKMLCGDLPYGVNVARCENKAAQNRLKYKNLPSKFPSWIDGAVHKACEINKSKRYDLISEFIYDLNHPNRKFQNKKTPPIIEKNPVTFWQIISLVLFLILLLQNLSEY